MKKGKVRLLLTGWILFLNVDVLKCQNILLNGGMEALDQWDCADISCKLTTDHVQGQYGIKVTERTQSQQGPTQLVSGLQPNEHYLVQAWIKLLNTKAQRMQEVIEIVFRILSKQGVITRAIAAFNQMVRVADGWIRLIGYVYVHPTEVQAVYVSVEGPCPGVNFIVDAVTVEPAAGLSQWRKQSDMVIETHRKSDINFRITTGRGISDKDVEIKVVQRKKSFPFGTAVHSKAYLNSDPRYRKFIHKHFNWAVLENALKWNQMEPRQGQIQYSLALRTIKKLRSHGIKVRGHNILWSVNVTVPDWVQSLRGQELRDAVTRRIQGVINITKDLVEHWDVNNENLHGTWYQDVLQDPDYNLEVFRQAHRAAPHIKLFLNEFNVVAAGTYTNAYLAQAMKFKEANVGLYGLGVQCHFKTGRAPDPVLIKEHLDILQKADLPIWVTELDVVTPDEHTRADWYEIALRALYGHPAVEGILLWGFWDRFHWRGEGASLVSGDSFRINDAGRRFLNLVENVWMTKESHILSRSGHTFTVRGFHGDYAIWVKVNGKRRKTLNKRFTLGQSSQLISLHIDK